MFIIKVTLKKISFCQKPSLTEVVTLLKLQEIYILNPGIITSTKKLDKVSTHFLILLFLVFFNILQQ